jgi:hypothetical protein
MKFYYNKISYVLLIDKKIKYNNKNQKYKYN